MRTKIKLFSPSDLPIGSVIFKQSFGNVYIQNGTDMTMLDFEKVKRLRTWLGYAIEYKRRTRVTTKTPEQIFLANQARRVARNLRRRSLKAKKRTEMRNESV